MLSRTDILEIVRIEKWNIGLSHINDIEIDVKILKTLLNLSGPYWLRANCRIFVSLISKLFGPCSYYVETQMSKTIY